MDYIKSMNTTMYIVGDNIHGQLGYSPSGNPTLTMVSKDILDIYTGNDYNIFKDIHNNYFASGYNKDGSCGNYNETNGFSILSPIKSIQFDIYKICVNVSSRSTFWITTDNKVYANGANNKCQLGLGKPFTCNEPKLIDFFTNLDHIIDIQPAANYTIALCALNDDIALIILQNWSKLRLVPQDIVNLISQFCDINGVYSAGCSEYGGDGGDGGDGRWWSELVTFKDKRIYKIRTGYAHSLFLEYNGTLWSCGKNDYGQKGTHDTSKLCVPMSTVIDSGFVDYSKNIQDPVRINFFMNRNIKIRDMECGRHHCLAVTMNGKLYSWGLNDVGQCGHGHNKNMMTPRLVRAVVKYEVIRIGCGSCHSYYSIKDDRYWLFGSNKYNECITYDGRDSVLLPYCIDGIVMEKTKGKIVWMMLGSYSTVIGVDVHEQCHKEDDDQILDID